MNQQLLRFVSQDDCQVEELPWGPHHWLCRPGLVDAEQLLVVRVHMPAGKSHQFHRHPEMEEVIYVVEGEAEQWVDRESRILRAGEAAHIPTDVVHGTYNAGSSTLVFLAILGPAKIQGPPLIEMQHEQPWCTLKTPV
jgi:quercetin dioxygenase-like cupin family protein